jgi:hypothetical protein
MLDFQDFKHNQPSIFSNNCKALSQRTTANGKNNVNLASGSAMNP